MLLGLDLNSFGIGNDIPRSGLTRFLFLNSTQ